MRVRLVMDFEGDRLRMFANERKLLIGGGGAVAVRENPILHGVFENPAGFGSSGFVLLGYHVSFAVRWRLFVTTLIMPISTALCPSNACRCPTCLSFQDDLVEVNAPESRFSSPHS